MKGILQHAVRDVFFNPGNTHDGAVAVIFVFYPSANDDYVPQEKLGTS